MSVVTLPDVVRGASRRARDGYRVRRAARALERREKIRFRQEFADFWVGDDDCWAPGHTDSLADAAFLGLLRGDIEDAAAAVERRASQGMGLVITPGMSWRLREFLTDYQLKVAA